MDFVARAGAVIDRAHRIAGVLLICVIVLGLVTTCQLSRNASLNAQLMQRRMSLPVIVVPGAATGLYSPTEDDRLTMMFTSYITQSINSFTPETMAKQYSAIRSFFSPALLTDSVPYFERKIRDSTADRRSSLFVPDESSLQVKKYSENGVDIREVTIIGQLNTIIAGTVAENVPLQIAMKFEKTQVSPANPYGLKLSSYKETPLTTPGGAPAPAAAPPAQ
ncbi:MAG: hypothetical protein GC129_01520 [Proteobacteria bacterium]|nr:hypothetical protein [Pseudomonadota bacterium]